MNYIFENARVIDPVQNLDAVTDIAVSDGKIADPAYVKYAERIDLKGRVLTPGFVDLHVHLRHPGNTAAETIHTGTLAAAAGGFTSIVAMPNTSPCADNPGTIHFVLTHAEHEGVVKVLPCGAMTKNLEGKEMSAIGSLAAAGAIALSDDGRCVQDHQLMRHIVHYSKTFNLPILDHCGDTFLEAEGVMNEGQWSVLLGMKGMPGAAEELMIYRDIILSRLTDCAYIRQHRNLVSILIKNFQQLSLCCGFALKRRLVRLISEKNVAHIHMVALLFQPLGNHTFFHGDSRFRHHYAYCHFSYLHNLFSLYN